VYLIGLTGGIASGKSLVAERLAAHGAVHIDADQLAEGSSSREPRHSPASPRNSATR
jgi:dephospho-CoA kinase